MLIINKCNTIVNTYSVAKIDRILSSRAKRGDLTRRVIPNEARNLRMLPDNHEIATTASLSRNDYLRLPRTLRVPAMTGVLTTSIAIGYFGLYPISAVNDANTRHLFANQALSVLFLAKEGKNLQKRVYGVPKEIDEEIARMKFQSMGIKIDRLTKEQKKHLAEWKEGT